MKSNMQKPTKCNVKQKKWKTQIVSELISSCQLTSKNRSLYYDINNWIADRFIVDVDDL